MTAPDQDPWVDIRSASTTNAPKQGKIKRPRRARYIARRKARPHRLASLYGPRTPVTLTLITRQSADLWMEVITDEGRFFVSFDASVFDLVQQIIRGGHIVEDLSPSTTLTHRRGRGKLSAHL